MSDQGGQIVPDDKDWTWTLNRPCPECGFEASAVEATDIGRRVTAYTAPWPDRLSAADVRERPIPQTWSPLEYGAHVRDVCLLFAERTRLMLGGTDPTFANWDQDATALEEDYAGQDPSTVADAIVAAGEAYAGVLASVDEAGWGRTGRRSNGSLFTVASLGRYGLHDLAHHLSDVGVARPE